MKNVLISTIIALTAISSGLYAQEQGTVQGEIEINLELVWEKKFEEGIVDVALYEENLMPKVIITGNDPRWG
ncbi:MAG TPA: hypothetical protein ENI34_07255, partial [candidate division WOR-3 bacterium]|nr:hypothetical protein [candidate division WOR-3 bacterium]